jgi:hypothetical protein
MVRRPSPISAYYSITLNFKLFWHRPADQGFVRLQRLFHQRPKERVGETPLSAELAASGLFWELDFWCVFDIFGRHIIFICWDVERAALEQRWINELLLAPDFCIFFMVIWPTKDAWDIEKRLWISMKWPIAMVTLVLNSFLHHFNHGDTMGYLLDLLLEMSGSLPSMATAPLTPEPCDSAPPTTPLPLATWATKKGGRKEGAHSLC